MGLVSRRAVMGSLAGAAVGSSLISSGSANADTEKLIDAGRRADLDLLSGAFSYAPGAPAPPQRIRDMRGTVVALQSGFLQIRSGSSVVICNLLEQRPFMWKSGPVSWSNPHRVEVGDQVLLSGELSADGQRFVDLQQVWLGDE